MSVYPIWNMQETRELIADLYGKDQMLLARESLNSVVDRRDFAHFHFHEAMDRWEQHLIDIKDCNPVVVALGCGIEEIDNRRAQRMDELAAHVQACVHSLHTIPDIMAHALYYSLALDSISPLKERDIAAKKVTKKLIGDTSLQQLKDLFESMYSSGNFDYLDALNNHGKHRSIVRTAIWSDLTGKAENPIELQFSDFSYDGTRHKGRDIRSILTSEYERIARNIIDCGNELLRILKKRKADLKR